MGEPKSQKADTTLPDSLQEDEISEFEQPPNALLNASFISRLLFMWPYPLLKIGRQRPLEDKDLPETAPVDSSSHNHNLFQRLWQEEQRQHPQNPSLHRALLKDYIKSLWFVQPLFFLSHSAKVVQAVALGLLVQSFEDGNDEGYVWAAVVVAAGVVILMEHHHVFFYTWRKGMQLRIASIAAIYDKSLRLSSTHPETSASAGRIMNLASNDVERFLLAAIFMNHLVWSPLQSIAILVVGWVLIGPAFAAGFALLVVFFVPLQLYLSQRFATLRSKVAAITDRRVNFVSQAVYGARVMKMSGYEWRFLDRIQAIRKEETTQISKANSLKALNEAVFFVANVFISLVIFLFHVYLGEALTPRDVFTTFTLINILQMEITKHLSLGVMGASECYVSVSRIQAFLEYPEIPKGNTNVHGELLSNEESGNEPCVALSNVTCYWDKVDKIRRHQSEDKLDDDAPTFRALSDVSIDFQPASITCIIGTVGSSKSALLQAIVGELPVSSGAVTRQYQTLSYAAQDPWIMDGTVKENIIMGRPLDSAWYDKIVNACGLNVDFEQFRHGDETIVGDRGVQCSGGQRARIGLARALYQDADILVADDPLSAVDARVGRIIYNEALLGLAVNRGKCVILATHQHQYVNDCRCVLMHNGKIECVGTYEECVAASGGKLHAHAADVSIDNLGSNEKGTAKTSTDGTKDNADSTIKEDDMSDGVIVTGDNDREEMNVKGVVRFDTYLNYFRAMGGVWVGVLLILLFAITQASVLASIASFGRWAERPEVSQDDMDIVGLVCGLVSTVIFLGLFRALISFYLMITASRRLHDRMASAVLRAKIGFFDTNPLGRILNRFSADVGINDDMLPQTLFDFSVLIFVVIGAIVTTVIVMPFTLVAFPFLLWYFLLVRRIFVISTRELKRLEGLARSPIFAMLSESLSGIATIRANDAVGYFRDKFEQAHDVHTRAFFSFIASSRWVGFRMDTLAFLFMAVTCFLSVLVQTEGWFKIDPTALGLSLSILLQLAGLFQWCIRQSAEVVNLMVSVERVLGFGSLPPEAELELDEDKALLENQWPKHGSIEFQELSARYRPSLPLVLDKISFKIPSGSRVGIVGRTGSGKSTVVQTLFRLLEAENGGIQIDGVDVSTVGLHTLRSKISVIPQVPTLFSGCSVRENLDLFGIHDDENIRKALEDAHILDAIRELPMGWDSPVTEGGTNFSVGQRQLLCLARAILNKNKILVLDEATASVDRRTDKMLHEALHESFQDATILAVAHRLDTVIDSDLILVLGAGRVLEFGSPADLIRSGGAFCSMVEDTGESMSRELKQRALAPISE